MGNGIAERNIALQVVLVIVTCGIYGLYWLYTLSDESDRMTGKSDGISPGMVVLLTIVSCGIFQIYWCYKMGEKFRDSDKEAGRPTDESLPILYLALAIANYFVGVTMIVNYCLMQDRINNLLRESMGMDSSYNTQYAYRPADNVVADEVKDEVNDEVSNDNQGEW